MKKVITKTNLLVVLLMLLIASLIGATTTMHLAHAQEEQPKSTVEFTSYTSIMAPEEVYEFAAQATAPDGTVTDELTWTSSDESVIVMDGNLAFAQELGEDVTEKTATITATAADGGSAYINVLVSKTAIRVDSIEVHPEELELGVGWTTRLSYTILPQDAYQQSVTWRSNDPSVVTVSANGNVVAVGAGTADIIVTPRDTLNGAEAICPVKVYADLGEATITPAELTMTIGQLDNNTMKVSLPDGVTAEAEDAYRWYSMEDSVASIDHYIDDEATIYAWGFGTTTIYAVVHTTDGVYAAMGQVHVTEQYFYLTGLDSVDAAEPWKTYDTAEEAQEAGVLLIPSETNPYIFSITRSFWAFDDFQIIHNDMDTDWTTKITSTSFSEQGSTMQYVSNTVDMFRVNALGVYTVTLDLSEGLAKVTIEMVNLEVTSFDISVDAASKPYLQGKDDTMTLDVYTIPENASINPENVEVTLPASIGDMVTATPRVVSGGAAGNDKLYIDLTLNTAPEANTTFVLDLRIKNALDYATDSITITVLADGEEYVPVSEISFNDETYLVNVNNGATPWISSTPLNATVNSDASVNDIVYTEESEDIYIEYIEGKAYVHAAALGTYTIYATSLGADKDGNTLTAETTVLVTSLVENKDEEGNFESYSTGFYLIGVLGGEEVDNWTSIEPEKTDFTGSGFEAWQVPLATETSPYNIYSGEFHFLVDDRFSIAFLGMNGNWDGIIDQRYFDWDNSYGNFLESMGNVQISVSGTYTVTLDLSGETPSWDMQLIEPDDAKVEYRLYYYIVWSGDSWDPLADDAGNVITQIGYFEMLNGVAQDEFVYSSTNAKSIEVNFYDLYEPTDRWPTIQFVSAVSWKSEDGTYDGGIVDGYFQDATWYGSSYTEVTFSGSAYSGTVPEGGANVFTNYRGRSELYWAATEISSADESDLTVTFTFTFNKNGVLTAVALYSLTSPEEVPAE